MFDDDAQRGGAWHIHLAHECDLMIIAPCTAVSIAKIAHGICDNSLTTLAIALPGNKPLLIAPAMDADMYEHPATQSNLKILADYGAIIIPPDTGELSSGLSGPGRLPDIETLLEYIKSALGLPSLELNKEKITTENTISKDTNKIENEAESKKKLEEALERKIPSLQDIIEKDKWTADLEFTNLKNNFEGRSNSERFLTGKKVLITAGPTIEKIDDVRFISNFSSGKMGYALADAALDFGAEVILVSGPVGIFPNPNVKLVNVSSAEEMYINTMNHFKDVDIAIFAAAVSDLTPTEKYDGKIKKESLRGNMSLELTQTKDILLEAGKQKTMSQIVVGFALESINEIENGWKKMKNKNCDLLVVNSVNKKDSGFQGDNNTITILTKKGEELNFPPLSKRSCAEIILTKSYGLI